MENLNPKTNPITTFLGSLFIALGLLMYALPMFIEVKKDFTEVWYVPLLVITIGACLIFSPDTLVVGAKKAINKGTNSNDEPKKD
jgi:uncharacterized membrane protein